MSYEKCLDMEAYQKKTCTWTLGGDKSSDPHIHTRNSEKKIYNNVLEYIGNTPMIRLNRIPANEGIKCTMLAKCEFYNPGGSTKDRIGLRMYQECKRKGKINDGTTIIEATSGNTA